MAQGLAAIEEFQLMPIYHPKIIGAGCDNLPQASTVFHTYYLCFRSFSGTTGKEQKYRQDMIVKSQQVLQLLQEAAQKASLPLEHASFGPLSEQVNDVPGQVYISKRYLYENVFKQVERAIEKGEENVRLNMAYLNKIAAYLSYKDYYQFVYAFGSTLNARLKECLGNWYSYVRCNSGLDQVLVSPVRIFEEDYKAMLELKGPRRSFRGEARIKGGCLLCLLEAGEEKELHLSFKMGVARHPRVLKGTFSGISTGGDPVAGREILVREESLKFEDMKNRKVSLEQARQNPGMLDPRIAHFFKDYEGNYIKVSLVGVFDLDDLLL